MLLFANDLEFGAAVLRASLLGIVGIRRAAGSVPGCDQASTVNTIGDQRVAHDHGAILGQLQVGRRIPDVVGVAADLDAQLRIRLKDLRKVGNLVPGIFGQRRCAGGELNKIQPDSLADTGSIRKCLLDSGEERLPVGLDLDVEQLALVRIGILAADIAEVV